MTLFGGGLVGLQSVHEPPTGRTFARQSLIIGDHAADTIASLEYDQE